MVRASASRTVNISSDKVWRLISDLERLPDYDPSVKRVEITSRHRKGIGASRLVQYTDGSSNTEEVVQVGRSHIIFKPKRSSEGEDDMTIKYAIRNMEGNWTEISIDANYQLRGGLLGLWQYILHVFVKKRRWRRKCHMVLEGIEYHLSTRRRVRQLSSDSLASTTPSVNAPLAMNTSP